LYALGELGDSSAGPEILPILSEPNCPRGVQLVAISTLVRIGYQQAASAISLFTKHEDVHIRLFAHRALAEFGEPVDRQFLLSALNDQNYIFRQEACGALAAIEGEDITQRLQFVAGHDFHESVRTAARIGLFERQIRGQTPAEKLRILRNALEPADRRTAPWIIRTILDKCGPEGRTFVEQLSLRDDKIGERARAFLIAKEDISSISSFDQEIQNSGEIEPLHATTPTHQTLMEYAISKAASLSTPLSFTSAQQTRMGEGVVQEDITWDILGESFRYLQHGYNPLTNSGFSIFTSARDRAYNIWNDRMEPYFMQGYLDAEETPTQWGGAWQQLGRVSHLLQDMSSPLHALATEWHILGCEFENFWANNDATLRSTLNSIGGPLHSSAPLPSEATAKLDSFTQGRLQYRYTNSCPQKSNDDVRGWIEVLAWTTYFRVTFWGQVTFGSSGSSGPATSSQTTGTTFNDGYVDAQTNTLNTMFNGNVQWIAGLTDNYYEITDRNGYVFRWMSYTDIDDWSSCGRNWSNGQQDSSIRIGGSDDDDRGVRITGRFWFDTTQLGKETSGIYNRRCYPNKYPNGDSMTDDLHLYYGKYGYPLTVRYNAGLLGLANRRVTVKTNYGQANGFTWSRKDNFGSGPTFNASTSNSYFYFVAKSQVDLTAPQTNTDGQTFIRWDKDGSSFSTNRTITVNTSSSPIPQAGTVYTAVYNIPPDTTPPQPNPMTWSTEPYETSTSSISMTATLANDSSPPVYYEFDFVDSPTGGTGGDDRGFDTSRTYTDSGLETNHQYGYRVRARDSAPAQNTTGWSFVSYDYTDIETPSGIIFGEITSTSIQVKSSNTPSGLTRGSSGLYIDSSYGTNSGWKQNNDFWTCSNLTPNYDCSFHIKARNGDGDETGYYASIWKYTLANKPGVSSFSNITTNSIQANWTSNGNYYDTDYYCENITTGQNSGWINNTYGWNNTGLTSATNYSFRAKARNNEGIETEWIDLGSEITHRVSEITSILPDSGPIGTVMTIQGQYFYDSGSVIFDGGVSGEILDWNDTVIHCRVPEGASTGNVVVQTPASSNPKYFTVTDPNIIYVKRKYTPYVENGTETYPFSKIQWGIDAATSGDNVIVANGTYTGEGNRDIDFLGKAITVRSQNGPANCIIDCQGSYEEQHRGFIFQNAENNNSILKGLTIINGCCYPALGGAGAGILCNESSPTILQCRIIGNYASWDGAGICGQGDLPPKNCATCN
jgi:hypothetical protein